ncbi:transcriptional regulator GcvA [Steroidobacter sp.]|uniref:transcriptional regulator GcvA n=1 Tax=Steroidobacter sp. TaxID=1978227 RepID=UPI001A50DF12|nr:transcriptional regulator GcvA [Steroidobacter sp.]MBL8265171.1 transcriptional regulator GcvA [Steroidobacter sp.]
MLRFLPSMISLQAFETAARHLSFSKAAEELSLTQSAVSQQMRTLETLLRVKLFHRTKSRLSLTEAGLAYLPEVRQCLSRLEAATLELMSHQGIGGVLNLAILPTFGTRWLIPRMSSFAQAHPHVMVNFSTRAVKFDFATERLDAAIHFGEVAWPGVIAHRLMGENVVMVSAPSLQKRLRSLKDLSHHTLLQHTTRPYAWQEWLNAVGVQDVNPMKGPRFEHFSMVIQAAVAGLGVAILPEFLVEQELAAGELVQPFDRPVRSAHAYHLVYPEENRDLPTLKAFRDWLLSQVAAVTI